MVIRYNSFVQFFDFLVKDIEGGGVRGNDVRMEEVSMTAFRKVL
jgi:hypothetical protein